MIWGTTSSSSISGSTLEWSKSASESRTVLTANAEETEADRDEGTEAGAFLATLVEGFFLADGQAMEIPALRFPTGAYLNFPSCLFVFL